MATRFSTLAALLGVVSLTYGNVIKLEDLEVDDTASVGSYIREVRAAPPESYHISHDDEGDAEVGYNRKKEGKGKKGYQQFDSFHKKDGDSYAFEKHDSFGYDDDKKAEAHGHHHDDDGEGAYSEKKEKKKAPKSAKYQEAPIDEHHSDSSSYDVSEGDADDGGSSSEGGHHDGPPPSAGSSGYDESDAANYNLPSGYSYGEGDEYNF